MKFSTKISVYTDAGALRRAYLASPPMGKLERDDFQERKKKTRMRLHGRTIHTQMLCFGVVNKKIRRCINGDLNPVTT